MLHASADRVFEQKAIKYTAFIDPMAKYMQEDHDRYDKLLQSNLDAHEAHPVRSTSSDTL